MRRSCLSNFLGKFVVDGFDVLFDYDLFSDSRLLVLDEAVVDGR